MTEDKILDFRERVQPRLRDYLKAAHIALDTISRWMRTSSSPPARFAGTPPG